MNPETFILWLQGYLDACGTSLNEAQMIELKARAAQIQMRGPFRRMGPPVQQPSA